MAAAFGAAEELDEVVALTVDALDGVRAVVGDDDERGVRRLRRLLNRHPDATEEGVEFL